MGEGKGASQRHLAGGQTIYWTNYTYDGIGRTLSVVAPDGSSTGTYTYQGNTTTVTDPAGKWKKFTTDVFGNLTKVTEPDPALGNVDTSYTYDMFDHLTSVSMPRGSTTQTRTFAYNGPGYRLSSATNPENGTVTYSYNGDGTLAYTVDAKNQRVEYSCGSYQRVTQIRRLPGVGGGSVPADELLQNPCCRCSLRSAARRPQPVRKCGF